MVVIVVVVVVVAVVVVVVMVVVEVDSSSRNHSSCVLHILTATACLPACICVMNMHMSECGACMHQCRAWCLRELFVLAESILNGGPRP